MGHPTDYNFLCCLPSDTLSLEHVLAPVRICVVCHPWRTPSLAPGVVPSAMALFPPLYPPTRLGELVEATILEQVLEFSRKFYSQKLSDLIGASWSLARSHLQGLVL